MKSLAEKLLIKEGHRVLFVNAPNGYRALLGPLAANVRLLAAASGTADVIQLFVANRRELERDLARIKPLISPGTILWVTYYKGTSKLKTDINRDSINDYAHTVGLQGVAMVSVDDDGAALRLKLT